MEQQHNQQRLVSRRGNTLIEVIIALLVIGITVVVFANLITVRSVNRRTLFRTQAAAIANEEISALKQLDIASISNQTNGSFLDVLYNAGSWTITSNGLAGHSGPSVVQLSATNGFSNRLSGRLLLPAGTYGDTTFTFKMNFPIDAAAGSAAGLLFRARDSSNGYRLLIAPTGTDLDPSTGGQQNWVLEKILNGAVVTPRLYSTTVLGIDHDEWNTISVATSGTSLRTYLNGTGIDSGGLTDDTFLEGAAALIGWSGAHVQFDDVTTVGLATASWNFDSSSTLPTAWVRLGLNDLPDTTPTVFDDNGLLTLSSYPGTTSTSLRQATVTVLWSDAYGTQSYTLSTILGNSHIGQ